MADLDCENCEYLHELNDCNKDQSWGVWWSESTYSVSLASPDKRPEWGYEDEVLIHAFDAPCFGEAKKMEVAFMEKWLEQKESEQ